jgi:hypothetical protein
LPGIGKRERKVGKWRAPLSFPLGLPRLAAPISRWWQPGLAAIID